MREIEIIKTLTEKLKNKGDVSQEEADLIYMLWKIHEAQGVAYTNSRDIFGHGSCGFPIMKTEHPREAMNFSFIDSFICPMRSAFKEWYKVVAEIVASGRTGNFVTTIPVYVAPWKNNFEKETCHLIEYVSRSLSGDDRLDEVTGKLARDIRQTDKLLTLDVLVFNDSNLKKLSFSRYGLVPRLERKTNDVLFLQKMTEKLKKEDITLEESDLIYIIMKFTQAMYVPNIRYSDFKVGSREEGKVQIERLQQALMSWFKAVHEAVKSGRKGNFLYTLPVSGFTGLGKSVPYIKKTLSLLPKQFLTAKFPAKPVLPDMAGIFFDDERNVLLSQRCEVVRKIAGIGKYIVEDCEGVFLFIERANKGDIRRDFYVYRDGKKIIDPMFVKFEYLNRNKIVPACCLRDEDKYFAAYDKRHEKTVRSVFEIPNGKLEFMLPEFSDDKDFSSILEESLYMLDMVFQKTAISEDDSWTDVIR